MKTLWILRTKILSLIDELERIGNITDVSGLYTAIALIDSMRESEQDDTESE